MNNIDWIDVKAKYGLSPDMPEVKKLSDSYEKELKTITTEADSIAKKAKAEKDAKKKKALEDSAVKTHQQGLIKLRKEIETSLSKITVPSNDPPRRIQVDHAVNNGTFSSALQQLKLSPKDPEVLTAFSMYDKAVDALASKANADLTKASAEKDAKKRQALEQSVMQSHQKALGDLRVQTGTVLSKIKPKAT